MVVAVNDEEGISSRDDAILVTCMFIFHRQAPAGSRSKADVVFPTRRARATSSKSQTQCLSLFSTDTQMGEPYSKELRYIFDLDNTNTSAMRKRRFPTLRCTSAYKMLARSIFSPRNLTKEPLASSALWQSFQLSACRAASYIDIPVIQPSSGLLPTPMPSNHVRFQRKMGWK